MILLFKTWLNIQYSCVESIGQGICHYHCGLVFDELGRAYARVHAIVCVEKKEIRKKGMRKKVKSSMPSASRGIDEGSPASMQNHPNQF